MSKVLMINPEVNIQEMPQGLIPTSWDQQSFWMGEGFSFGKTALVLGDLPYSPFLLLEARFSYLVSQLSVSSSTRFIGLPPLVSLMFFLRSKSSFSTDQDFCEELKEYSSRSYEGLSGKNFEQTVILDQLVPHDLKTQKLYLVSLGLNDISCPEGYKLEQEEEFPADSEIGSLRILKLKPQ